MSQPALLICEGACNDYAPTFSQNSMQHGWVHTRHVFTEKARVVSGGSQLIYACESCGAKRRYGVED